LKYFNKQMSKLVSNNLSKTKLTNIICINER
jgi:hypothetical protein